MLYLISSRVVLEIRQGRLPRWLEIGFRHRGSFYESVSRKIPCSDGLLANSRAFADVSSQGHCVRGTKKAATGAG